ncbi:SemiSWEET family sugar transporter [Zoogloea sp. 1C4]|uniref:SemiSWEET family sugar transporter n=1 Tax=Zoogloea sp. 1C4 TaxID=2570190 RepID=UPI0012925314|nr:SemiSWEET transporter [Zoogloea sp. 1C4]
MDIDTLIGTIAGCLSTAAFVPQAWQIWKTKSARDVSWAMYAVLIAGVALWIVYGLRRGALPLVLTNGVILAVALVILAMKRRFGDGAS